MFGMANLRPDDTGLSLNIHVYKNHEQRARHGPRVKVYPGKVHEGNATVVTVPTIEGDDSRVVGRPTISRRALRDVRAFVDRNWLWLTMYWYNPDFDDTDLRDRLE